MTPQRGMRFLHARRITGSPKAGTATPVECVVTRVTKTSVYFRQVDGSTPTVVGIDRFHEVVGSVVGSLAE